MEFFTILFFFGSDIEVHQFLPDFDATNHLMPISKIKFIEKNIVGFGVAR